MQFSIESHPAATADRIRRVDEYMSANVLSRSNFVCSDFNTCRASHGGPFFEGQLHHVGAHYDLGVNGRPCRIAVVGQEYGNGPSLVRRERRTGDIVVETGIRKRFFTDGLRPGRNPHMKGTTSVLRLLFGMSPGPEYEKEFIVLDGQRVHMFEAFALTNFLLCSAIAPGQGDSGSKRGKSSKTMQQNCARHFVSVMRILEPTILIIQGRGVRDWLAPVLTDARSIGPNLEHGIIGDHGILIASFAHPSVPSRDNWGTDDRRPYLLDVVAPAVRLIHDRLFG